MQVITTVTQKGQITIPKQLRDKFGMGKYDKVIVKSAKNYIQIKPTFDLLDIAGTFHPRKNKNKSALEAREYMEKHYKRF